jgi:hypothetical protein
MSKINYDKLYNISAIFPTRHDNYEVRSIKPEALEELETRSKNHPLFFTIDGVEQEGAIKFFSYNNNDHSAVIVLTDDDGHTRVIDSEESLQKYMNEVGAECLFVAAESQYLREWRVVNKKYYKKTSSCHYDVFAMIDRLIELGEGKVL